MLRSAAVSACCTIRYYWSVRPWSDASRFLSWALPARWDWSPHAHLPSLVMLIFFLPFSWHSSLIAHLHLHLYLHLHLHLHRSLFLHHYSYNTLCLSSPPALFLPSLLFTAASSGSSSIICFLHLHYTAYTLIVLHLLQLPQQVLHCAVVGSLINTSFIANINGHWQAFPTLLLPLLFVPATKVQSVRSYSRCLPG